MTFTDRCIQSVQKFAVIASVAFPVRQEEFTDLGIRVGHLKSGAYHFDVVRTEHNKNIKKIMSDIGHIGLSLVR